MKTCFRKISLKTIYEHGVVLEDQSSTATLSQLRRLTGNEGVVPPTVTLNSSPRRFRSLHNHQNSSQNQLQQLKLLSQQQQARQEQLSRLEQLQQQLQHVADMPGDLRAADASSNLGLSLAQLQLQPTTRSSDEPLGTRARVQGRSQQHKRQNQLQQLTLLAQQQQAQQEHLSHLEQLQQQHLHVPDMLLSPPPATASGPLGEMLSRAGVAGETRPLPHASETDHLRTDDASWDLGLSLAELQLHAQPTARASEEPLPAPLETGASQVHSFRLPTHARIHLLVAEGHEKCQIERPTAVWSTFTVGTESPPPATGHHVNKR